MRGHPGRERLNDYLDGELQAEAARGVELHLEECGACRRELDSLRELVTRAADLPRSIEPNRDLWLGIRRRIDDSPDGILPLRLPGFGSRFLAHRSWELAAAAVLLVAATATVTWSVLGGEERVTSPVAVTTSPGGEGDGAEERIGVGRPVQSGELSGSLVLRELAPAEGDYLRTTARLLEILNEHRDRLAPETREALDRTLATIDRAIRDLRSALEQDPNSRALGLLLESTYRQKIDVLQQAVRATGT